MTVFTRSVALFALICFRFLTDPQPCAALPPTTTLNFDFGNGRAYIGDDGVISSPGGIFWNKVTASDLNAESGFGSETSAFDEFGSSSAGGVVSWGPNQFTFPPLIGWEENAASAANATIADGLRPESDPFSVPFYSEDFALLSLLRVQEFQEMVLYFDFDLPIPVPFPDLIPAGGFSSSFSSAESIEPLMDFTIQRHTFGIVADPLNSLSYIHITDPPPRQDALGFGQLITLAIPDSIGTVGISAIQIRGAFGLPEPTSVGLLGVGILCSMTRRRR